MTIHAFVLGVARSGTTATAQLLNTHPSVCMGIERYKRLFRRTRAYPPDLLTKERFFSFDKRDTNLLPHGHWAGSEVYDEMPAKWDTASVVGDKEGYDALAPILSGIADARIIYMLRPLDRVASSWNRRALDAEDTSFQDFRVAVHRWNEANSLAYFYSDALGDRLFLLDYEAFYSGSADLGGHLLDFLGLAPDPQFASAYDASVRHYKEVVEAKPLTVLEGQQDFIEREANLTTYRLLSDMAAGSQAKRLSLARRRSD